MKGRKSLITIAAVLIGFLMLTGCTGIEDRRDVAQQLAHHAGMNSQILQGGTFRLQNFYRFDSSPESAASTPLRVYIEGDGFAWINRYRVSSDPTPRNPVALKLAAADRSAAVLYVARPCQYTDPARNPNCAQKYWTSHRFAPEVIASTSAVIDQAKKAAGATAIELIGFSGGGAVAVLVAARRSDVVGIRTVGGNLDHVTLNRRKKVSPLTGSLNAADVAVRVSTIPQIHFIGSDDDVIGAYVVESYRRRAVASTCIKVQKIIGASHTDGWVDMWPNLLTSPLPSCQ